MAALDPEAQALDPLDPLDPLDLVRQPVVDPSWVKVTDEDRARARDLGVIIPPNAWNAHFNDEGKNAILKYQDRTGKWQYGYDPQFTRDQALAKFDKLDLVRKSLPFLDDRVMTDLERGGFSRDRILAGIVRLMRLTGMRVGGDQYAREHGTYGASSLLKPHVEIDPETGLARVKFTGKHHIQHDKSVEDSPLVGLFQDLKSSTPGDRLFQYEGRQGFSSAKEDQVNDYLSAHDMTAHNLRTYNATRRAHDILFDKPAPENDREARRTVQDMAKTVARELGNTPAMALRSYISPAIINAYESGNLVPFEDQPLRVTASKFLEGEERFHASLDRIKDLLEKGVINDELDPTLFWPEED